ncbi:MAG: gamma carbonic anhydrase family protein [Halanaerobium sp.]|nr:gamma carbonic anhydrase family protein [Halanaerobium sp.]
MDQQKHCYPYRGSWPELSEDIFLAPGSRVIGNVKIGRGSSVWFNTVVRGDVSTITIGTSTNIQDNSVLHVDRERPLVIGAHVTVGHNAILHSCQIGEGSLIGMGATVLTGAKIGKGCLIAAGSLVTEGAEIPDNSVVMGIPGKIVRKVSPKEAEDFIRHSSRYQEKASHYLQDY